MTLNIYEMNDFDRLIKLFRYCMIYDKEALGKKKTEEYRYSQVVFVKQLITTYSLICIARPLHRPDILGVDRPIHDSSSGFILLRSMYELLIRSYYILLNPEHLNYKNILWSIILLHSTKERHVLATNFQNKDYMEKYLSELSSLRALIKRKTEFENLPKYTQDYIDDCIKLEKNKNWYRAELENIAVLAGFHKSQHFHINKFCSNHIHSDGLALQQIGAVNTPSDAEQLCSPLLESSENYLSQSLNLRNKICLHSDVVINIPAEINSIIDHWAEYNKMDFGDFIDY